ncbi:chemotaxis protein CheW [Timonella sp. A28]|uniref:chemotaxis protein CheW n=1 Tax=Timonella sp. A28 TaxID=3442640 RepID=UPI003EBA7A09
MAVQYITFTIAGGLYGIEVLQVEETLGHHNRTPVPLAPRGVAGLVNLRGQVVTTIDVRPKLGLPALSQDEESMMVVIDLHGESMSLLVDEVGEVLSVEADAFEPAPPTLSEEVRELVTGAYKLEGRLLLTLDVAAAVAA